jgi:hypothetical protein
MTGLKVFIFTLFNNFFLPEETFAQNIVTIATSVR